MRKDGNLTSESVEGASLSLESIDNIHSGDSLPLGVFGVGDGVSDNVLQENLQNSTGLLVDQAGDALDTATASEAADRRLGDALDVVTEHLAVALRAALAEAFATLAASRHICWLVVGFD